MPFETFTDSRGNSHEIYMQERHVSCAIAAVCTLLNLMGGAGEVDESHIRILSQKFAGGYKPHPMDAGTVQFTFLAALLEKDKILVDRDPGAQLPTIAKVLAEYNVFSSKQANNEIENAAKEGCKDLEIFKGKILLLAVKTIEQVDHAIIIRDIWEDGTAIIYDSADGLVELKELDKAYSEAIQIGYVNYQDNVKAIDLEAGPRTPTGDDIILGADAPEALLSNNRSTPRS